LSLNIKTIDRRPKICPRAAILPREANVRVVSIGLVTAFASFYTRRRAARGKPTGESVF
jgi:hypothetical protein